MSAAIRVLCVNEPSVQATDATEGSFRTASFRCAAPAAPLLVTAFSFMFVPLLSLLLFVTSP